MQHYQFHIGDYTAATAHLSPMEDLAYRRLLDLYYSNEAPIPLDVKAVARRVRLDIEPVQQVLTEFFQESPEGYRHHRCDDELQAIYARSESARKSVEKRWERQKATNQIPNDTNVSDTYQERITTDIPIDTTHYPLPITQGKPKTNGAKAPRFDVAAIELPDCIPRSTWESWIAYRRSRKLTCAEATIKAQVANLEAWHQAGHDPPKIIADSISNGWQGLFEPKQAGGTNGKQSRFDALAQCADELTGRNRRDDPRTFDGYATQVG